MVFAQESLEFMQREVRSLIEENIRLRCKLEEIKLEEKRNEYNIKRVDEKLEKQDTCISHNGKISYQHNIMYLSLYIYLYFMW